MSPTARPRPRTKPQRSIRLCLRPSGGNPGIVSITVGKETHEYLLEPLACDFGRAFRVTKQGSGEEYDVLLATDGRHSCECPGFLRWRHCKHSEGLLALINAKLL